MITKGNEFQKEEIELVFDYLFHKQCMRAVKMNLECRKSDFRITPPDAQSENGLWQFTNISGEIEVLTDRTFRMDEMVRIAKKALFIANALKMREVFCNISLKQAYF